MNAVQPLSVFIIAKDEAPTIGLVIDSVLSWADEVIVIDSGSTDGTQAIAEGRSARVVFNPWPGYGAQKRFGEDLCRNDWVLNLDADEIVSDALANEICTLFACGIAADAYSLPRRTVLPGEARPRRFAPIDRWLRLYRRSVMRFANSPIHDKVEVPQGASVGRLTCDLEHRAFRSFGHLIAKYNAYTDTLAANTKPKPAGLLILKLLLVFPGAFFKGYVLRRQFTLGWYGFALGLLFAFFRATKYVKQVEAGRGIGPFS